MQSETWERRNWNDVARCRLGGGEFEGTGVCAHGNRQTPVRCASSAGQGANVRGRGDGKEEKKKQGRGRV